MREKRFNELYKLKLFFYKVLTIFFSQILCTTFLWYRLEGVSLLHLYDNHVLQFQVFVKIKTNKYTQTHTQKKIVFKDKACSY